MYLDTNSEKVSVSYLDTIFKVSLPSLVNTNMNSKVMHPSCSTFSFKKCLYPSQIEPICGFPIEIKNKIIYGGVHNLRWQDEGGRGFTLCQRNVNEGGVGGPPNVNVDKNEL